MTALRKYLRKHLDKQLSRQLLAGLSIFILSWATLGCTAANSATLGEVSSDQPTIRSAATETATAIFAGGCFWCMEQPFDQLPGVSETTSGYTGGTVEDPTYYQVSDGNTGHVEAVEVTYDPTQVDYDTLLETFWHNVDPTDNRGQFCDKGSQYRSAIFYDTPEQQNLAQESKAAIATQFDQSIATDILPAATFYPAEDYHQNYYQTRPVRYKVYRFGCGRDQRLSELWGDDASSHD